MNGRRLWIWTDATRGAVVFLAAVFVVSRLGYYAFGVRFDASPVTYFIQIIDVELLRTDLVRSLGYMHSQPPLFNLAIGLVLKLCPAGSPAFAITFGTGYALLGLGKVIALYLLATSLGARPRIALLLAAINTVLPTTVRYENWLLYSHPVAALVCITGVLLHRTLVTGRSLWAFFYFLSLAALSLTRLTMNWMWFAVCAGVVIVAARKEDRRRLMGLALVPALLVASLTLRHLFLFGSATTGDALLGGNLSVKLRSALSSEQTSDLLERQRISPLFHVDLLSDIDVVKANVPNIPPTGVPVVDADRKSTGESNFNNLHYRALSLRQFDEATAVIRDYPGVYFRSIGNALLKSFAPAGSDAGLPRLVPGTIDQNPSPLLLTVMPLLLVYGIARAARRSKEEFATRATLGFLVFNIVFLTLVTCAISYGDFSRYRFEVDGFYVVLLALALSSIARPADHRHEGLFDGSMRE